MTDHNPYVGIQRTVFEQGWKRALNLLLKELTEMQRLAGDDDYEHGLDWATTKRLIEDARDHP